MRFSICGSTFTKYCMASSPSIPPVAETPHVWGEASTASLLRASEVSVVLVILSFIGGLVVVIRHRWRAGPRSSAENGTILGDGIGLAIPLGQGVQPEGGLKLHEIETLGSLQSFGAAKKLGWMEGGEKECSVCLITYKDEDTSRRLDKCGHSFHKDCIDHWLSANASCPLCRVSLRYSAVGSESKSAASASSSSSAPHADEGIALVSEDAAPGSSHCLPPGHAPGSESHSTSLLSPAG
eukprot:TRINITY_DN748_c0_g1_i1.p1 TRINITY_DN748_c0_g1~~TRINITY_DN748_c0_g1_i1.p1  ORF type:complete len:239 (+),score=12.45 TRINITY_DN748_c0_g1_i1:122-838(+)